MAEGSAEDRFTRLWVDHRGDVTRFVQRRVPDDMVDDVVSETFTVAWRRLDEMPGEERAWLFGVARNVMATHTRTHGRWRALAVRAAIEPPETGLSAEAAAVDRVELARAWMSLTDGEREVMALVAWEGLTTQEAAQVLGCRPSTFSVRLVRARRHLVDALERGSVRAGSRPPRYTRSWP
ncbi:RNA polymerase sigma factor [Actinotalea subterranea]|uniref:RNA polymerase sigma factor n=1 Tax=Actinotalea subterranea TaxID=2607497 RepID=UPI00165DDD0E|nr:sigma-70 family RNA polymerase sigma factor [Actinotalea subterranea]